MSDSLGLRSNASIAAWMRVTPRGDPRRIARRAVDHRITVRAGHDGEPGEQLVGAVPPELALVALLERLLAAAALAVAGDPLVELDDLGGVALGERRRRRLDARQQVVDDPHHRRTRCRRAGAAPPRTPAGGRQARGRRPARGRARCCRRPSAAASRAASSATPSSRSRCSMSLAWIVLNSIRAQRDEIVTRSCGTKSARIKNVVDGGGSSIVFSRIAAPSGREQVELVEDHHLAVALDRRQRRRGARSRAPARTRSTAPTRATSRTSGCSPRSTRLGGAFVSGRRSRAAAPRRPAPPPSWSSPPDRRRGRRARARPRHGRVGRPRPAGRRPRPRRRLLPRSQSEPFRDGAADDGRDVVLRRRVASTTTHRVGFGRRHRREPALDSGVEVVAGLLEAIELAPAHPRPRSRRAGSSGARRGRARSRPSPTR